MDEGGDGTEVIIVVEVDVGPPPGFGLSSTTGVGGKEGVEVGFVLWLVGALVVEFPGAALHLVEVAVGELVLVEKLSVHLFDGEVEALEVGIELVAGSAVLAGTLDDAEVDEMRVRGGIAREVVQAEARSLEKALFAALLEVALLDEGGEIELAPTVGVFLPEAVPGFEAVAAVEVELPHVLAHRVAPDPTAGAEADVVVDDTVVDQGALPEVVAATVLAGGGIGNRLCADVVVASGDELIDGDFTLEWGKGVEVVGNVRGGGRGLAGVIRNAVVDEIGEVWLRIVGVRGGDGMGRAVSGGEAVADETAVGLDARGDDGGENVVACEGIAVGAVVAHGKRGPARLVAGIGDFDVIARLDDLIIE